MYHHNYGCDRALLYRFREFSSSFQRSCTESQSPLVCKRNPFPLTRNLTSQIRFSFNIPVTTAVCYDSLHSWTFPMDRLNLHVKQIALIYISFALTSFVQTRSKEKTSFSRRIITVSCRKTFICFVFSSVAGVEITR